MNDFGTQFDVNGILVVDHLNVPERKMKLQELQVWPHLSDLELTEVAGTQVTLLLGSDVAELVVPLEILHGLKGSPVGVRTREGWTVTGRVPGYIQEQESVCKVHVATPEEELNETVNKLVANRELRLPLQQRHPTVRRRWKSHEIAGRKNTRKVVMRFP